MLNNRLHKRIDKVINLLYSVNDVFPIKWDMSVVENFSTGGVRFIAPKDLNLEGKSLHLRIKLPQLAPNCLELEALVVSVKPRPSSIYSDVRVKFINLSHASKVQLAMVEKMIDAQDQKNK